MNNHFILKEKTVAGVRNRMNGLPNQDSILSYADEDIILICVSDGCTNCEYPVDASRLNGKVALKIAKKSNIFSLTEKKIKQQLSDTYNEVLSNSNFPYEQLCATTAFVLINRAVGVYMAFSVGDTAVMTYDAQGQFKTLLEPMNLFRKSATCFTNDSFSVKRFSQFKKGKIDDIAGFVIYSDGAESIAVPPYREIKRLVSSAYISDEAYQKEEEKLFRTLQELDDDDISIALIAVSNNTILQSMTEFYKSATPELFAEDVKPAVPETVAESSENSDLISFLMIPRTPEEVFGFIEGDMNIVPLMTKLVREGVVSCTADGRFSAG